MDCVLTDGVDASRGATGLVLSGAAVGVAAGLGEAIGTSEGAGLGVGLGAGIGVIPVAVSLGCGMVRGPIGTPLRSFTGPCGAGVGDGVGWGRVKVRGSLCAASGVHMAEAPAQSRKIAFRAAVCRFGNVRMVRLLSGGVNEGVHKTCLLSII